MNAFNSRHSIAKDKGRKAAIIFGGSGFIGRHLCRYLIENRLASKVYSVDIVEPKAKIEGLEFIKHDIREPFNYDVDGVDTIYNLAAIHTTPGHPDNEYFETNIRGAENICSFADKNEIDSIVFTSSIAPYGVSEEEKQERCLPQPKTAYASSKLAAEYIHQTWLEKFFGRRLAIVRPGVVFGFGEAGNFTRLYRSLKHGYFFYPGRKNTKKACIYIKDCVRGLYEISQSSQRFQLYNFCYEKSPSIETIIQTISEVTGLSKQRLVVPAKLLKAAARILGLSLKGNSKRGNGICPERVLKLMQSTNISGKKLANSPYALKFSLKQAIEDWYQICEKKGLY